MTVFISYSSRDRDAVKSLVQDLQDADEQVWMDQRLAGGDAWWRAILEQIRGCDVFVFALSQCSIESKPCQAELQYAQALGLPILPVQVGPVDSMQLNPLATVQAVDYRHSTQNTGMRLIAALHREAARRQPLPEPLPAEPPVPFEYLIRLYTTIANPEYLTPRDQATVVAQLQVGLREDGEHEAARNDIVALLRKLHDREDVTYRTRTEVEAILASLGKDSPPPVPTPPAPARRLPESSAREVPSAKKPLPRRLGRRNAVALGAGAVIVAAGIIAAVTVAGSQHSSSRRPTTPSTAPIATPQLIIENNRYTVPARVSPNASFTVINHDPELHTIQADRSAASGLAVFEWILQPNSRITVEAPGGPGDYPFHDRSDPAMRGVLVVR